MTGARSGARALVGLLVLCLAGAAGASPGGGIRLGGSEGRLHPYLELESRWDSNIAYSAEQKATSGFVLHVRPGLTLDAPGDPVAVTAAANLDWAQYFGENDDLSNLYGAAQLGVGVNRRGALGLEVTDAFRRTNSSNVLSFGGAVIENSNQLAVAVPWRPGGGALVTTLKGGWQLESYEPFSSGRLCADSSTACDPGQLDKLGYSDLSGGLDVRWKFLPRTAAVVEGEYWRRLPNDASLGSEANGWRAWGGLAGLFAARVAGTVKGGWGAVSNAPSSSSSWLANVEAEWLPLETVGLKLGYLHDLGVDPGRDNAYTSHRVYAEGRALLASRYAAQLAASYERRDYSKADFTADLFTVSPSLDAELARWLRVGAGLAYTKRSSEVPAGAVNLPGYDYHKTEAFLRVRGTY